MARGTFTLFVGVFNVALYLFMTIFVVLSLVAVEEAFEDGDVDVDVTEETTEDSSSLEISEETAEALVLVAGIIGGIALIMLAHFVLMFIASVLLVYGVKKEQHKFIAPWVILNAIGLVVELFVVWSALDDSESDDDTTFAYIVSAVISAAIWYPVYQYYQSLKNPQQVALQCNSAAGYLAPTQVCAIPSDFCHANAKYVPTALVAAHQPQVVYPEVPAPSVYTN